MKVGHFEYNVSWARLISDVLSPPVVWAVLAFPIAFRDASSEAQALAWAALYVVLVCVMPIAYIGMMVKRGHITDMHMQVRQQRIIPFVISIVCAFVTWAALHLTGAPFVLPLFAIFTLVQLIMMLVITFFWQISGATVATAVLFGAIPAMITVPLVVLVGAARVKLKRHTPAQVIAGTFVGLAVTLTLFEIAL